MYGTIVEAAVREQQTARVQHATEVRLAHAATAAAIPAGIPAPTPLRERSRRAATHPVSSFHRWLAAGQL